MSGKILAIVFPIFAIIAVGFLYAPKPGRETRGLLKEKAGEIAKKTIDTMIEKAKPGVKECELYADMIRTQIANGGEAQIFLLLA